MANIQTTYQYGALALASYAVGLVPGTLGANQSALNVAGLTQVQIDFMGDAGWEVVNQSADANFGAGFSATLFHNSLTGEYVFANRGTVEAVADFLGADAWGIALMGTAGGQIVDMLRYYKQLITPSGASVSYSRDEIDLMYGVAKWYHPGGYSSPADLANALVSDRGLGKLTPTQTVTLDGHSLGGHLSLWFKAFHPGATNHVYTFNGAGLGGAIQSAGTTIAGAFGNVRMAIQDSGVTNIFGDGGPAIIAGVGGSVGTNTGIRIEAKDPIGSLANGLYNHSIVTLVDALAICAEIEKLDPTITATRANALLDVASNQVSAMQERALDSLRLLVGLSGTVPVDNRSEFYIKLKELRDSAVFQSLAGKVVVSLGPSTIGDSKTNFGAFLSLAQLSPFSFSASGQALETLKQVHAALASRWDYDVALSADQRSAGMANYSDTYLSDRYAMSQSIVAHNQGDLSYETALQGRSIANYTYTDLATGLVVKLRGTAVNAGAQEAQQVMFGNDEDNGLVGSDSVAFASGDRLYGGNGADFITGKAGDDYLEGNSGQDNLLGGSGADVLLGGSEDDTLDGGADNDKLLGGSGNDTYRFVNGEGQDVISDGDGQGVILLDGTPLNGGGKLAETVWESADKKVFYTKMAGNLIIGERAVAGSGTVVGTITVKNWQPGQLGITLSDQQTTPPAPSHAYTGDYSKETSGQTYVINAEGQYVSTGAAADAADVINGSSDSDSIVGVGGNDGLAGLAGNDYIVGGNGDDLILGGSGADTIEGGIGADEILGSGRGTVDQPTSTNFTPPSSGGHPELARGFSWVIYNPENGSNYLVSGADIYPVAETTGNIIDGGAGDDRIGAGTASDTVHGGDGNDVIVGMGQSDVLFGDAGNDQMQGDGPPGIHGWSTATAEQAGDYMDGGAGDDAVVGEGGDDVLFGDDGNDIIYGDDLIAERTPLSVHGNDYLDGEADKDTLVGGGRDDQLFGGEDDDQLYGDGMLAGEVTAAYEGNDYLDGEDGKDLLVGGGKDDELFGGDGDDTLLGDASWTPLAQQGSDYLDGEAGNDQLRGYAGDDQLFGGEGADTLQGDAGNDYMDGEADADLLFADDGNDTVAGGLGNDELQGGAGDDNLSGGDGNDNLLGQVGNDQIYGDAGADTLQGADGDDNLDGGDGIDKLFGDAGNDMVAGGEGSDAVIGGAGMDQLAGGGGNDNLQGGTEADSLDGGADDDLVFGEAGNDTATGGDGNDQVQGGDGVDAVSGGSGNDLVVGDAGDDVLNGDDGRDELQGGTGADSLMGGADNDVLFGQANNDTLDGNSGNDILQGDDGADVYAFGRGGGKDIIYNYELNGGSIDVLQFAPDVKSTDVIAYRDGLDQVYAIRGTDDSITVKNYYGATRSTTNPTTGVVTYYYDYQVEQVKFGDGVTWAPWNAPTFFRAQLGGGTTASTTNAGNDVFVGTVGNDAFSGAYGSDTYLWGAHSGRDTVSDSWRTGDVDTIRVDASIGSADVYAVKSGIDDVVLKVRNSPDEITLKHVVGIPTGAFKVVFEADGTVWDIATVLAGIPASAPAAAAQSETASVQIAQAVQPGAPQIAALSPQAAITGTSGNDSLQGTTSDDSITALGGNDTVIGNAGNDLLDGGVGTDSLVGGMGNDVYVVDATTDVVVELAGEGTDTIQTAITLAGLAANVENLTITGTSKANATGNTLANVLTGNTANNSLSGGDGDDRLIGGGGTDTLVGGKGNDYFVIDDSKDVVTELAGEGSDTVEVSFTGYTLGTNIENMAIAGTLTAATGNALDNVLTGNALANAMVGNAGNDTLIGGAGNDTYTVTEAGDVVVENLNEGIDVVNSSVTHTLSANVENLTLTGTVAINGTGNALDNALTGNTAANSLTGGDGNDTLNGGGGADTLVGGLGNDTYVVTAGTVIVENPGEGIDTVSSSATLTLSGGIENLTLTGTSAINATGDSGNNVITGNDGANVLDGAAGTDTVFGGLGNDTLYGDGRDELHGGVGNDTYILANTNGLTIEYVEPAASVISVGVFENDGGGIDTVQASFDLSIATSYYWSNQDSSYHYTGNIENATLSGTGNFKIEGNDSDNVLTGNSGNNWIYSWRGADKIDGGAGNDSLQGGNGATLIGGQGDDTLQSSVYGAVVAMQGGVGNDLYVFNQGGTGTVTENAGEGVDTLDVRNSGTSVTLAANIENLFLSAGGGVGIGNAGDNWLKGGNASLSGGLGNDTLEGSSTAVDTLVGGAGDDIFVVSTGDVVTENAGEGTDTVQTYSTYTLATNFENLTLLGTSAVNATGNTVANVLTGNSAANVLTGGAGDDIYVIGAGDTVVELAGEGTDTIRSSIAYSLASLANVENLELTGTANLTATGNAANNVLTGNGGANTLDGSSGADTMKGAAGDDTYVVDNPADVVTENLGEGTDTVQSSVTFTLGTNVENIVLTGSAAIDATGNDLNNTLTGNSGVNKLTGGLGNDTYVIGEALDTVIEASNAGTDTVLAGIDYTLGLNLENLTLTGSANINGTGNDVANVLTGNGGANVLTGRAGDDTYVVGYGDSVVENGSEGTDTVRAAADWTLSANVENLVLLYGGYSGYGNALNNAITGNDFSNTLDGSGGADTLVGALGNDLYFVDNAGDMVTELAGEGTDTVNASVTFTLASELEHLVLSGAGAIDGTGNSAANSMTGNSAANKLTAGAGNDTLDGGAGNDTLIGGSGDDLYVMADSGDVVTELAGEGVDTVQTSIDGVVLGANVENIAIVVYSGLRASGNSAANTMTSLMGAADTLAGGAGDDTYIAGGEDTIQEAAGEGVDTVVATSTYTLGANIENLTLGNTALNGTGNSLDNTLTGNSAANVLTGGAGNDTYVVDAGDTVVENAGEGTDTVRAAASFVLAGNVENLVLTGTAAINGTGNALDNSITGNTANNVLDGLGGADTLAGGAGDDTYNVQDSRVAITENAGEGADLVISSLDNYTLGANLENLQLAGVDVVTGTGNSLNNVITGSVADNVLFGGVGDDTLDGGMGADTLMGGTGNDTYDIDNAADLIVESAGEGTDTVRSRFDYALGANVENLSLAGYAAEVAVGNALNNVIVGSTIANVLDGQAGADTMRGGAGDDVYYVDDALDVVDEVAGANEGNDTVFSAASYVLGAEVENLTLTGSAATSATGNANANKLVGNSANNVLTGAAGDDTLDGGAGADTLSGGSGRDTFLVDNAGDVVSSDGQTSDGDTVISTISYTIGGDIENLQLAGSAITGTGNSYANVLIGNDGANVLDGAAGADAMIGGLGDDVYVVDNAGDWVGEYAGEGFDEVRSSVSLTLGENVEALTLTGAAALTGTANGLDNVMRGNAGNNSLIGGAGNDIYRVGRGSAQDVVNDGAGSADQIDFDSGVGTHDVQFVRAGADLILKIVGTTDQVQVVNYFDASNAFQIEEIRFADSPATVVGLAGVNAIIAAGGFIA